MSRKNSLLLLCCLPFLHYHACAESVPPIDRQVLFRHIHETFNTPSDLKFVLKDLKPSPIPGFMVGRLEIGDGPQQVQTILISNDGRFYFLAPVYKMGPATVTGFTAPVADPSLPPPPPAYVSADGQYLLFAKPLDLSVNPDEDNLKKIKLTGVPGQGPEDAPVTLVEYSDLECPHCKRAYESVESDLLAAYKGKLRVVFKNYPLTNIHPWAHTAALAEACAGEIKPAAAERMQSSFFREQESIKKDTVREKSLAFAKAAGLDAKKFEICLDGQKSKPLVDSDIAEGDALGVSGTPTIFINGRRARSYDTHELRSIVDEMLAQKAKK